MQLEIAIQDGVVLDIYMNTTAKTASRTKAKRRVLDAVYETSSDLHRLGFIDKHKMAQYEDLCMDPTAAPTTLKIAVRRVRY